MEEAKPLLELDVMPDCIWGDEDETILYAQALGQGRALIFRFYLNPRDPPESLPSRIVNCYHDIDVPDDTFKFQDRAAMQSAVWSSMATVWPSCITNPKVFEPGTVVDPTANDTGDITWRAYREPLFDQYLDLLRNIQRSDLVPDSSSAPTIDISKIDLLEAMGGRGCSKRAHVHTATGQPTNFVFNSIDFQTYLILHDDDDEFVRDMVETWRRSSKLIADVPPRPNIQASPKILVTVRDLNGNQVFMGHLSTFFDGGDLASLIKTTNKNESQIPLQEKARWCHQMSLAVAHTHGVLHTFHMDIKPGDFLVDS
ncbi:hypothetical protein ACHAPT_008155 [Fusarium lateritium]